MALLSSHDGEANTLACLRSDSLGSEEMKIALGEEGQVIALSKGLDRRTAIGESVGVQVCGARLATALRARLAELNERERRELYYEDVFAELMGQGHRFGILGIPSGELDRDRYGR